MEANLRTVALTVAAFGLLTMAGCTSATLATPTAAPAKPVSTSAPAAPPASGKPGASPTVSPAMTPSSKPAAATEWKAKWDEILAAAKKEGKVTVAGGPGDLYRTAAMTFQKAYPDIQLEFTGVQGADFMPKLLAERDGGQYLWDLYLDGGGSPIITLKPKGVLDPLKPALVLPEVLDDSKWVGGFEDGWADKDHQYIYTYESRRLFAGWVNRSLASEAELTTVDQLLDPKWKGKIASGDPRLPGSAASTFPFFLYSRGEDWFRKLLAQDLVIIKDERQLVEFVVRGRYPVAIGTSATQIDMFRKEGLMENLAELQSDTPTVAGMSSGFGHVMLINRAPHPNAAKVFANWLLTQEAQKAHVDATGNNSRRLDVPGAPEYAPRRDVKNVDVGNTEELLDYKNRATDIAKEMLK